MEITDELMIAYRDAVRQGGDSVDDIRRAGLAAVFAALTEDQAKALYNEKMHAALLEKYPPEVSRPEMISDRLGYPPEVGDADWQKFREARGL